jgi:hypothetical protein
LIGENKNLIYDIDMHKVEDTEFYLNKGYSVIGFEANPQLIEHCKIHFQDAIKTGRLHIVEGRSHRHTSVTKLCFSRILGRPSGAL